jgi:hypothetical protein
VPGLTNLCIPAQQNRVTAPSLLSALIAGAISTSIGTIRPDISNITVCKFRRSIAERLNHHESGKDIEDWMAEFDNLSKQLVMLLMRTKKKI